MLGLDVKKVSQSKNRQRSTAGRCQEVNWFKEMEAEELRNKERFKR